MRAPPALQSCMVTTVTSQAQNETQCVESTGVGCEHLYWSWSTTCSVTEVKPSSAGRFYSDSADVTDLTTQRHIPSQVC